MIRSIFYVDRGTVKKAIPEHVKKIRNRTFWVDIENPSKTDMDFLKQHFKFHKLALEDCMHAIQRPKLDNYDRYYFIAMHELDYRNSTLAVNEIDFFLGPNYVITVHKGKATCVEVLRDRITQSRTLHRGADFALYVMLDIIVDDLFPLLDKITERLEHIESRIVQNQEKGQKEMIGTLFRLRRDVITLRKYVSPEREVLNLLTRGDAQHVAADTIPYLRDVYDHLYRITENVDMARDIIISAFETYLTMTSNRLNEIMKTLTIITTVLLPMTVITGIYGMNFRHMPELDWTLGYPFALVLMLFIAIVMLAHFRRKGWI